ncbi:phage portal protein [Jeongeupia naejangsanensis]|uniref:Phage portal protein n=1 Tax=Jeongeupia naejangsanensis TaxID=613195 RepID=A0ABS2BG24_9NEIS|nr:phage portal protein [Jeongeupia naejangsanensis]MBM3114558.1 phage portal protein [Jeongeupia naejangsanensis]
MSVLDTWLAERRVTKAQATPPPTTAEPVHNGSMRLSQGYAGTDLYAFLTGGLSAAGMAVNERTAMNVAAVFACVGLIGGSIAALPLPIYRWTDRGRETVSESQSGLWRLLNLEPWPSMSAAVWRECMMTSVLLQGDAFARIHRKSARSPEIAGFEPLPHSTVEPIPAKGRLLYRITPTDGGTPYTLDQDDMLHVPGVGFDGQRGLPVIRHALRNVAGTALAASEYTGRFFSNGARPDFVLQSDSPKALDPGVVQTIRETWAQKHQGVANSHLPAILSGGLKIAQLTMSAEDAQLLGIMNLSVEEVARIFGVPPFMIGHVEKTSSFGTGIEQQSIGFVKFTLLRHLVKFAQELNRKVFRGTTYCEFDTTGLERGDTKSRYEAYRVALGRAGEPGWMTPNEVRHEENRPDIPGGERLYYGGENATAAEPADQ